jgi:hypothetical protein
VAEQVLVRRGGRSRNRPGGPPANHEVRSGARRRRGSAGFSRSARTGRGPRLAFDCRPLAPRAGAAPPPALRSSAVIAEGSASLSLVAAGASEPAGVRSDPRCGIRSRPDRQSGRFGHPLGLAAAGLLTTERLGHAQRPRAIFLPGPPRPSRTGRRACLRSRAARRGQCRRGRALRRPPPGWD